MKHAVLYTADMHGNEVQYKKLVQYALDISADSVIIGGDLAPKGVPSHQYIPAQRAFLENRLAELLAPLKGRIPVFLLLGNDDRKANEDVFSKHDGGYYTIIHEKRVALTPHFDLVGYSCVPITPFGIKDWEKFDLTHVFPYLRNEYEHRKRTNYRYHGLKSTLSAWKKFSFTPALEEQDSIQLDLQKEMFIKNPDKTIYVIHTPPNKTNLDQIARNVHVGSFAVRLFIEHSQPYLTLHGHIHETVAVSGKFFDRIKNTLSLSPGNHNIGPDLAVLVFDAYDLTSAERKIL